MLLSALSKTVMKSVAKSVAKVMEVSKVILPQESSWKMLQVGLGLLILTN